MYEATLIRRGCCVPMEIGICLTGTVDDPSFEKNRSKMPDLRLTGNEERVGLKSKGLDSEAVLQSDRDGSIMGGVGRAA